MAGGVREMLCFQADTAVSRIVVSLFAALCRRTSRHIYLQSRLIGKAGHADAGIFGKENSGLSQSAPGQHQGVVICPGLLKLWMRSMDILPDRLRFPEIKRCVRHIKYFSGGKCVFIRLGEAVGVDKQCMI